LYGETTPLDEPPLTYPAALIRLWLLRPVIGAPRGRAGIAALIMGAVWLSAWVALDHWESEPDPRFIVDGIPLLAWYGLAILGLAFVLRQRSHPAPAFAPVLALSMGAVPLPLLLFAIAAAWLTPAEFDGAAIAVSVYTFLYLARALHAVTGGSQRAAAFTGLVFIAAFVWLTDTLNVVPDVWTPTDAQSAVSGDAQDEAEAILFDQAARIDQALAAMDHDAPSRSSKPRAFFLGFAGVGDEKVFAQEIGLAGRVLGERYGMDDRSLSLINDQRDLQRAPLATVSGLKYALQGLGSRMNLDRDVLFLSISSHGAKDPAIVVSNSQLPLKDLSDEDLADALRESGIKWRVIIISACYAGAFIDSLRDPQTIVITAAAADRTSFGCSNDRDLTYFGEAFYRDALPGAGSLQDAFETAKSAIGDRERREGVTASNPQAYFGAKMQAKLASMNTAP
jgi:hypothetical protein